MLARTGFALLFLEELKFELIWEVTAEEGRVFVKEGNSGAGGSIERDLKKVARYAFCGRILFNQ
jgi:hypothetical protein